MLNNFYRRCIDKNVSLHLSDLNYYYWPSSQFLEMHERIVIRLADVEQPAWFRELPRFLI